MLSIMARYGLCQTSQRGSRNMFGMKTGEETNVMLQWLCKAIPRRQSLTGGGRSVDQGITSLPDRWVAAQP